MRILNKLFTKNKLKNNIECVFKHSIACSAIKRHFFHRKFLVKNAYPQEVMKKIASCLWQSQASTKANKLMHFASKPLDNVYYCCQIKHLLCSFPGDKWCPKNYECFILINYRKPISCLQFNVNICHWQEGSEGIFIFIVSSVLAPN